MTQRTINKLKNSKAVQEFGKNAPRATREAVALRLLLLLYGRKLQQESGILLDELTDEELINVTAGLQTIIDKLNNEQLDHKMSVVCQILISEGFSEVDLAELVCYDGK